MAEPTIQDIFGAGATQTATAITILKADLDMTAAAVNRGEQSFAAIVKKAATYLNATNFALNVDQSIEVADGFDSIVYRTINNATATYLQTPLTVNFRKVQTTAGVTPDDY
jgi:S-adenosylhomocysteine hydrolase